jgi:protein O-GlcNAc transferase
LKMPAQLLQAAIDKHQAGALEEAGQLYTQLLLLHPKHLDALRLMSLLAEQRGDKEAALSYAKKAVTAAPKSSPLHLLLAQAFLGLHRLEEALSSAETAVSLNKRNIDAWLFLGDLHKQQSRQKAALDCYQRVEALDKRIPELYNNRGNLYSEIKDYVAAEKDYRQAISLQSNYWIAYFNLGKLLHETERYQEAIEVLTQATRAENACPALVVMGMCLRQLGHFSEAVAAYEQALVLMPTQASERPVVWYNLGNVHSARKQWETAAVCYRESLRLKSDNTAVLENLANVLIEQGDAEAAIEIYQRLSQLFPEEVAYRINQALTLPVLYISQSALDRWRQHYQSHLDALLASELPLAGPQFASRLMTTGFYLAYQGKSDFALQQKTGQILQRVLGDPAINDYPKSPPYRERGNRKRRIGFISRHLAASHTIGKLMGGIIKHLDRELFEVQVFSIGPKLNTLMHLIADSNDRHSLLDERDIDACCRTLTEADLDVLYFTDLGMDVMTHLLAHHRFAPLQCTTWGHPVTSGSPAIDIFFSSQWVESENAQTQYNETLIALENYPFYYERPILEGEGLLVSRADLGLESNEHLYTCVQSLFKMHPDIDRLFGEILKRDSEGVLVLLSHSSDTCTQAFLDRFGSQYPELLPRVRFVQRLPRAEFLGLLAISDILLDSIYFSGGNTSYEGFAFGTPIITLESPYMKGRLTAGLARMIGLEELIANTKESYIEKAVFYGTHPDARQALKEKILQRCPQFYERLEPVRELEHILIEQLDTL